MSPEPENSIKTFLALFMSEDDIERFMDLRYVVDVIKQGQHCWRALFRE